MKASVRLERPSSGKSVRGATAFIRRRLLVSGLRSVGTRSTPGCARSPGQKGWGRRLAVSRSRFNGVVLGRLPRKENMIR
jgi:hypothetical protein